MFLIKDIDEYNLVKTKKIVAENKEIFFKLKHLNIKYFYKTFNNSNQFKNDFYLNWFRDYYGNDLTRIEKISFGHTLSRNFIFESTNLIKLKRSLDYYLNKNEKIYIFKDNSNIVRLTKFLINNSLKYKKNIILLKKNKPCYKGPNPLAKRGHITPFKNKPYIYFFLKFIQFFYSFILTNKILYFKDWSSLNFFKSSNKILILNNKNIFKSFFLNKPLNFQSMYKENHINKLSNFNLDKRLIRKIFVKNKMVFTDNIYYLLNHLQKELIVRNKKTIIEYLNIYQNFLNFYKPKAIILPSGDPFHFSLLCQLAKKNMTKVILCVDGYQIINEHQGLVYETKKKDTVFDFIFCPGKSYKKLMIDLQIKKKKLIQIDPPIFSNYEILDSKNSIEEKYDVMIIGYIPNTRNLNCFYDSNIDTELEILNVCSKLKLKKVSIKLKSGSNKMTNQQNTTINLYKKLFKIKYKKNLNIKLSLEYGQLYNVINKPKIIIGPLSTSYIEALHNKSIYYVYEPKQNGLTELDFSLNRVCKKKYISRSPSKLIKSINSKNYLKIKKNFFSEGKIDSLNKFLEKI